MKLNLAERLLVNSPLRALSQRYYEVPYLLRSGGRLDGGRALELGCGRGVGTRLILERFGAASVDAIDIDPEQVRRARSRVAPRHAGRVDIRVGDAAALAAAPATYDAVFDFAVIHHVPDWQRAVSEIARVLKPGGKLFFEEVTRQALDRWLYRTFLEHPAENRFSAGSFLTELERCGIRVNGNCKEVLFGDFLFGVGTRE